MGTGLRESFLLFYELLGNRPSLEHSVDRKNNDGNYSCGKCEECIANGWLMNLRWATKSIQGYNTRLLWSTNTSGYRGVCYYKHIKRWVASIRANGKSMHIGTYKTPAEAARAYNEVAIKFRGEYAQINIIENNKAA